MSNFSLAPYECQDCHEWWWDAATANWMAPCDKCGSTNIVRIEEEE